MVRRVWIAVNAVSIAVALIAGLACVLSPVTPSVVVPLDPVRWHGRSLVFQECEIGVAHVASRDSNGRAWMSSHGWWLGYWTVIELAAILPLSAAVLWALDERRRRRALRRKGCRSCGYDLTGNVSGVCPECGTAVKEGNA